MSRYVRDNTAFRASLVDRRPQIVNLPDKSCQLVNIGAGLITGVLCNLLKMYMVVQAWIGRAIAVD